MFISYAQNGEDVWLNRVFEGKNDGFYIDVGAHHPVLDSVTKAFYDRGWSGVNVEPIPELYQGFVEERQRDVNLLCACGSEAGKLTLHVPPEGQQGVATLDAATAASLAGVVDMERQISVDVKTLAEICGRYARKNIDFLKIDVEGFEGAVLAGMDFEEFRPTILIVEAVKPLCLMRDPVADAAHGIWHGWEPLLMDAGYVFATFDGLNRYYVRKEDQHLVAKFIIPISRLVDNYQIAVTEKKQTASIPSVYETDIKAMSRFAARFAYHYRNCEIPSAPCNVPLKSKASTQADIDSPWCCYWTDKLKMERIYHRKIWELSYVPQALYSAGMLKEGKRGIVFGCCREPLPSLFASMGCLITATDVPSDIGWKGSTMFADSLESLYMPSLVSRHVFERAVTLECVDMNSIPEKLFGKYDFCWSICALEHLGSLQAGLDFVKNSLKVVKRGGVAVHTTTFNFLNNEATYESEGNCLYQRKHFEKLVEDLQSVGHTVAQQDYGVGDDIFDKYVDTPSYDGDGYEQGGPHLKLDIEGYTSTCFGIIITKGE